jgi:cell division protein FtsL
MHGMLTSTGAIRARWAVLMVLVAAVLVGAGNVAYTSYVQRQTDVRQEHARREADQRWCALMAKLDQPEQPATTERGRAIQQQIHQLRRDLGCEEN